MPQFSITSEINVDTLLFDSPHFYKLSTGPSDHQAITERFGWISVDHLSCDLCIRKMSQNCWEVTGHITGQIVQNCILTGLPVPENIDFQIEERYVRIADQADQVEVGLDGVEPIKNGAIDIGELAVQSLCLAAAAWPRVDDAPELFSICDQKTDHPFAVLSSLKRRNVK